jgi:predicted Rossmann-fold nucleotide-binding protein
VELILAIIQYMPSEAKKVAEVIVEKGMNVVFGGGDVGLMGVVSHTAIDNGGEVLGISLQSLYELELTNPRIQEVRCCSDSFRKERYFYAKILMHL